MDLTKINRLNPLALIGASLLLVVGGIIGLRGPSEGVIETKTDTGPRAAEGEAAPIIGEQGEAGTSAATPGAKGSTRGKTGRSRGAGVGGTGGSISGPEIGVKSDSIKLGFIVVSNNSKLLSGYGVRGGAIGDTREQVAAVVADVNTRGILGRKVVPVIQEWDATNMDTEGIFARMCAAFTQDDPVFAVLAPFNPPASFPACLAKAKTLFLNDALTQEDAETFTNLNPYLITGLFSSSRGSIAFAKGLHEQGFFAPGTKLGVIRNDSPTYERVYSKYFKPMLESLGVTPFHVLPARIQTVQNAVTDFRGKGIDRVAFLTTAGGTALFFMNHAQSQNYFPRYGLASPDGPAFQAQNAPYTQLRSNGGALGVGWMPGSDVFDADGPPFTAAEKRCLEVHKKAGTDYNSRNEGALVALAFCDVMWLFEETAIDAGRDLTRASFATALGRLGTRHQTPLTFATQFAPGKFDGAIQYRLMYYDDAPTCRCFKYTSAPAQSIPR